MYTTVTAVKSYLGISTTTDDGLLATLIATAQQWIDSYTRRTFEASSDTTRYFDARTDLYGNELWLDADLCQVGTVTNGDGSVLGTADYVTEPRNTTPYYMLKVRSDSTAAWTYNDHYENSIAVTGRWAYSTSAPADVAQACVRLTAWLYHQKDNYADQDRTFIAGNTTVLPLNIPTDVRLILDSYKRKGPP
jgi:hypothetical protein